MATKLGAWNLALADLGEAKLVSDQEEREARYECETHYDDVVQWMLERAFWNFALRRQEIAYDSAVTPSVGYDYAFEKPADWAKTYLLSDNLQTPFPNPIDFADEGGYWHANITPIQIAYVSLDLGTDEGNWPASFLKAMAWEMAARMAPKLASSQVENAVKMAKDSLRDAKSQDALDEKVKFTPPGRWSTARISGMSRRDGGNRGSLVG